MDSVFPSQMTIANIQSCWETRTTRRIHTLALVAIVAIVRGVPHDSQAGMLMDLHWELEKRLKVK